LGLLLRSGKYVAADRNEAFHWFKVAAESGDSEGELQLGACYHYGFGTPHDFSMAAKYYRLAAKKTNYVAMKSLGYLLMSGLGLTKDLEAAKYWLTRAAKEGGNPR